MFTFHDGTLTQNHVDNTFRMLCYMADSTPLEKHFQVEQDVEKNSSSYHGAATAFWQAPVREKTLTKVFKFKHEVEPSIVSEPSEVKGKVPTCIYNNRYKGQSIHLRDLPSKKQEGRLVDWQC